MAHLYLNKKRTAIVIAHLKCGYSSMEYHKNKNEIEGRLALNIEMRPLMKDPNVYKMMIVRNPYSRLESFYKHWIKVHPTKKDPEVMRKSDYYESCSLIFSEEKFINREINFEEFVVKYIPFLGTGTQSDDEWFKAVEGSPEVRYYAIDGHTYPQTRQLLGWHATIADFDEIIRLENKNFDNLNSKMGINLEHKNSTSTDLWKDLDLRWSAKMKHLVYKHYQEDFENLGYNKGTRPTLLEGTL